MLGHHIVTPFSPCNDLLSLSYGRMRASKRVIYSNGCGKDTGRGLGSND
jgi:hypothetical protein